MCGRYRFENSESVAVKKQAPLSKYCACSVYRSGGVLCKKVCGFERGSSFFDIFLFKSLKKWYNIGMCEILAPAGDKDSFFAAIDSGADAVYLGLTDFSARKSAANFSLENLKDYADYAHILGVKVYVALNTLVKEEESERFFECAREAWNAGADALILQDIFLGKLLKSCYPEMVLHLSTQAGVCNVYGARLAKRYGFSRVILSRETPLSGIRAIASIIETEVFVQGALCTCFSGQCYLSAFIGGNSGNRGFCKQPCRKKYRTDREGFTDLSYKLSLADLCVGEDVKVLADAGVSSFKIEGRMRSPAYVGAAVKYYKDILLGNKCALGEDLSDLKRAFNRGDYTKGYLFGQDKNLISSAIQGHKGEFVGVIGKSLPGFGKLAFVRSEFSPEHGDGFKVIRGAAVNNVGKSAGGRRFSASEKKANGAAAGRLKSYAATQNGTRTDGFKEIGGGTYLSSYPRVKGGFFLPWNEKYKEGDGVYITLDSALAARIGARKKLADIQIEIEAEAGKALAVFVSGRFGRVEMRAEFVLENAKTRAVSAEEITSCFLKTDAWPFRVAVKEVRVKGEPFIVRSALNAFRRTVFKRTARLLAGARPSLPPRPIGKNEVTSALKLAGTAVIDSEFAFLGDRAEDLDIFIFSPKDYRNSDNFDEFLTFSKYYAWHKYLYLPAYMTDEDVAAVLCRVQAFDGVYAEGVWAIEFCKEKNIPLFAGTGFNLFNSFSIAELGAEKPCALSLSKELSDRECKGCDDAFRLAGGGVKVMELGHCPFAQSCASCDRREYYSLTDEQGRVFPLRRYENSRCRFELFNCMPLAVCERKRAIFDLRSLPREEKLLLLSEKRLPRSTAGLSSSGVL